MRPSRGDPGPGVSLVPFDRPPQPGLERRGCAEAEFTLSARYIQASPRLAVGLARVPRDLALEAGQPRDQRDQIANLDFGPGAQVHRLRLVVFLSRKNQRPRAILDVQELTACGARAPHLDPRCARRDRFETLLDERWNHMRLRGIE